jgi:hypothetical protein
LFETITRYNMPLPLAIPLAMAGIGAATKLFGANKAGKRMDQAQGVIQGEMNRVDAWYDTEKNQDYLQSNIGRGIMTQVLQDIEDRNNQVESTAAITGASDASVLASKKTNQKTYGDAVSQIARMGTAREDQIDARYANQKQSLAGQMFNVYSGKAQNAAQVASVGGDLMGAAGSLFGATKWGGAGLGIDGQPAGGMMNSPTFGRTLAQESTLRTLGQ